MPLELYGSIISGIRVEFAGGRAVKIDADENADTLRAACAKDDGGTRLGELALVDGGGRMALETVFFDTLLDENAASHIALGSGYALGGRGRAEKALVNESQIHIDFMIGSPELAVDGITGRRRPRARLRGGPGRSESGVATETGVRSSMLLEHGRPDPGLTRPRVGARGTVGSRLQDFARRAASEHP